MNDRADRPVPGSFWMIAWPSQNQSNLATPSNMSDETSGDG